MGSFETRSFGGDDGVTLVEFLLARIDEDEAVARAYLGPDPVPWPSPVVRAVMERALEACQARRRLVAEHLHDTHPVSSCTALKLLAAGHLDHPDHCEEWRS